MVLSVLTVLVLTVLLILLVLSVLALVVLVILIGHFISSCGALLREFRHFRRIDILHRRAEIILRTGANN